MRSDHDSRTGWRGHLYMWNPDQSGAGYEGAAARDIHSMNPTDLPACLSAVVISDTHGKLSAAAITVLNRADLIIHAGDMDTEDVLNRLLAIAPVVAVRGNMDRGKWASRLPLTEILQIGAKRIYLLHDLSGLNLTPSVAGIDVVIHGHTHQPMKETRDNVLIINPGSASHPRHGSAPSVMILSFNGSAVTAECILI